jgi:SpoVK/Ycf46/Vps4 family AAA+-type ATPase
MLEYYDGMLFLTTNRLDDFDEAFYNRVHVTIKYEPLLRDARRNIWQQHLGKAAKYGEKERYWTSDIYDNLSQLETNGRDIRNFTRTALAYAKAAKEDFSLVHILTVIRNNFSGEKLEKARPMLEALSKSTTTTKEPVTIDN